MSEAAPSPDFLMRLMAQRAPKTPLEMRAQLDAFAAFLNADPPEVAALHEQVLVREVRGARVRADVAVPHGEGPHPVLVYLHGGGWVCGSPASHRKLALRFAEAGQLVFSIDYRLSPEHPFPAAFDDCAHAIRWAAERAAHYGGDASRLSVGGDSAGANLAAAAVASLARDAAAPRVAAALLIYGVYDLAALDAPGGGEPEWIAAMAEDLRTMLTTAYLGASPSAELLADPRVSPIHAAAHLPPCHLVVGTLDPLARQQEALAKRLAQLGIEHESHVVEGMPHAFVQIEGFPEARACIDRMVAFLRRHG
jgi:acetyl esterase